MAQAALDLLIQLKGDADKQLAGIGSTILDIGKTAAGVFAGGLLTSGFSALTGALAGGIEDARGAAVLFASTEQTIASMGNAAGVSAQHVVDMASSLSDAAGQSNFGDDLIQASTNLLLTFGNLKGETLDAATALTVDLAAALGGEPQSHAMMLGKALNDPVKGLTALGKAGLTFTEEQKAVIAAMVKGGDMAGAQGIIIAELNKQVGGQAKAAADAAGGWVQFNARMGEAAESVMAGFLPVMDGVANVLLASVVPAIERIVTNIGIMITAFQDGGFAQLFATFEDGSSYVQALAEAFGLSEGAATALASVINGAALGFQNFLVSLRPVGEFLAANLQPILFGIGVVIATAVVPAIISAGIAAVGAVASFALLLAPLIAIGAAAALLYAAWQTNFGGIQQIIQPVIDAVVQGFGTGGIGGAISGLITSLQTAWPQIQGWFATAATAIAGQLLIWAQAFLNWIGPMIPPVLQALVGFASSIANWIVAQAPGWLTQLMAWGQAFVNWIGPAMPLALAALGRLIDTFFNWIAQQVAPLIAKFSEWANALVAWIVPATVKFLGEWPGMLNSFLNWIGGAVGPLLAKLAMWAGAFISWIVPMIPGFIAGVAGIAAALLVWIAQTTGVLAGKLIEWGMAFISWIGPKIPGILAAVGEVAISILAWIGETAPKLVSKLVEWGLAFINWIGPKIPGILAAVGEVAVRILAWIGEQVGVLAGKLVEWGTAFVGWVGAEVLPKLPGALATVLTTISDWVGTTVTWAGTELAKIGKAIVGGIQSGISAAWGAFQTWIGDQVAKIPQPIRTALGMGSPSRVMAEQVGLPIVQGIVMGVESGMSLLTGTMTKVGADITTSAKGAITGVASAFQNNKLPEAAAAAGRDIIAGWMGGMRENFSGVTEAAAGMGEAVISSLKGTFEIGSPSQLMSREIGIPIVDGITAGINIASPKLSERMLQLGTMLVDLVSKGVDAFGKLRSLGTISMSSITQFASTLQSAMTAFGQMTLRWDKAMMSAASQFTRKSGDVIDLMSKGVEMLAKLKDFEAVPATVFREFSVALEAAILEIVRISTFANRQLLTNAQSFSEGAIKVIAVIGVGVDALTKLGTLAAPTQGAFLNFSQQVSFLVFRMGEVGARMSVDTVAAAAQFSEGAGKVLGLLGTGVDGLLKLSSLTAPLPGTFLRFSEMVGFLVLRMGQTASQFSADAVKSASVFAEGAGKILSIVGSGVDSLTKLADFQAVGEEAMGHFANAVNFITRQFTLIASTFDAVAVAAAGTFAESASKVVATVGTGVEGFTKLADFKAVGEEAMGHFVNGMRFLVQQFTVIATLFTSEGMAAASLFADGAGKILGVIGAGVDGFVKLYDFREVPELAIAAFQMTLYHVVENIMQVSEAFTTDGMDAASQFAEGAGKIISIVGGAVDGFVKLHDFKEVPETAIAAFQMTMYHVVENIMQTSEAFTTEGMDAAAKFADGAGKILAVVGNGVDGFLKLHDFKNVPETAIAAFQLTLYHVVENIMQVSEAFTADGMAAATSFAEGAGKIVALIGTGIDGLIKLADFKGITATALNLFAQSVRAMLDTILHVASLFTIEAINAAIAFAEGVNRTVKIIIDALDTFAKLGDFQGVAGGVLSAFTSGLGSMLNEIQRQAFPATINIGQQMMLGIANGITSYQGAVVNAMINAVWAAVQAAQTALGIASPSKVFEQLVGAQVGAGMAQGIVGSTPQVVGAAQGLAGAAVGGAASGGSNRTVNVTFGSGSIVIQSVPGETTEALANKVMDIVVQKMQTVLA